MLGSTVVVDFIAKTSQFTGSVKVLGKEMQSLALITDKVRKVMFGMGVGMGASLITAGYKAASFEKEMQNVNSVVQDSDKVFARTSAAVLDLATQIPQSANDLAKGAYQVVSAGFTNPKQTVDILAAAGKAASAGLTDMSTSALAVVTTMNAYGAAAGNATHVSDLLFQTVKVGQVSFEQLAVNLGDFIGIANAAGGTLAETLSAYASITIATGQASRSATSLQGIYRQLIKPMPDLSARLEDIGFSSGKAAVETLGLQQTLMRLTKGMATEEIAKMFQDVEGLNGVLALTGPNAQKAVESLKEFTDVSKIVGATQKAQAEQAKSFSYQLKLLGTTTGALGIEFGKILLPAMKLMVGVMSAFAQAVHSIPQPIKSMMSVLAVAVSLFLTVGVSMMIWYSRIKLVHTAIKILQGSRLGQTLIAWAMHARTSSTSMLFMSKAMTVLGHATGITSNSLTKMATVAGLAVAALIAVPAAAKLILNVFNGQDIDGMTQALIRWSDAGTYAASGLEGVFGPGLARIGGHIQNFTTDNEGFWDKLKPKGMDKSVKDVDSLDKALTQLVNTGNKERAAAMFKVINDSLAGQGITGKQMNQAFNDYLGALAQIDLQGRSATDGQFKMKDAIDSVEEAARKTKEQMDAYKESLEDIQGVTDSFLSLSSVLGLIEDKHRAAFDETEKRKKALEDERDRTERLADARDDVAKAQAKVNSMLNNQTVPGSKGWRELQEAQQNLAKANRKVSESQKDVNVEYKKTTPTVMELVNGYQKQIDAYNKFNATLIKLAGKNVPVEIIRELQKMGPEGVAIAEKLANATPAEFEKIKGVLAEKVKMDSEKWKTELDTQLVGAASIARLGAGKTVEAIQTEMNKIAPGIMATIPDVISAMKALGYALTPSSNTTTQVPGSRTPDGRIVVPHDAPRVLDPNKYVWAEPPAGLPPVNDPKATSAGGGGGGGGGGSWGGSASTKQVTAEVGSNNIAQWPGSTSPDGRKVVSKDAPRVLDPKQFIWSTLADRGAQVRPGFNMIENRTRVPEWVLTAGQMQGLKPVPQRPASVGGNTTSSTTTYKFGDIYAQDLTGAMRQADQKRRLGALAG